MRKIFFTLFSLLILTTALFAAAPPAGSTCATAVPIASVPFNSASLTTCGFGNDYANGGMCGQTLYGLGEDYLFSINIVGAPITYNISIGGIDTYKSITVFNGCPSPANNPTNCIGTMVTTGFSTTGSGNFTFPSNGTYYIMIDTWPTPICAAFTLSINLPPTCPGGLGTGVVNVPSLPYASGAGTTCGSVDDITSANVSVCGSSSLYTTGEDIVFKFTPATSGNVTINLTSSGSYTGLMLYDGCPFTANCVGNTQDFNGNKSLVVCVNAGTTYYLVLDSWTTPVCNPYSNLTISTPGAIVGNDFCASPTPIIQSAGNLNGNTNTYTVDSPGNLSSVFCGSIENNQWYSFVATATSHTFNFTVSGCTNGWGIQAQVFSVTTTGSPCISCNNFTSMGTCYNPATTAPGSTTASGLTIGQTYYLQIDGNSGDLCNFQLSGWATTILLPIELISFNGKRYEGFNKIEWITATEMNNEYFVLEYSIDGLNFNEIYKIKGTNNNKVTNYSFIHKTSEIKNYYRLNQIDYDGKIIHSNIITVTANDSSTKIVKIVNILGQDVDINYEGFKVFIFNDGLIYRSF